MVGDSRPCDDFDATTQAPAPREGISGPCRPKSLLVPLQVRVNCCTSTSGPANFLPENRSPKTLFYMKQQDRLSECNQLAEVGKEQLEAQSATSTTSAIAEIALRFNFLF